MRNTTAATIIAVVTCLPASVAWAAEPDPFEKDSAGFAGPVVGVGAKLALFQADVSGPVQLGQGAAATPLPMQVPLYRWAMARAPSMPTVVGVAAAKVYLDELRSSPKLLESPEATWAAVDAMRAGGVPPKQLLAMAGVLASGRAPSSPRVVTMGAVTPRHQTHWRAVVNLYVAVLQTFPDCDKNGAWTKKALQACVSLGDLDGQAVALEKTLDSREPGLVGALLYKIHKARRRHGAARRLMAGMLEAGERYFPKSAVSSEVLRDGFRLLVAASELDTAARALRLLEQRREPGMPKMLLDLAVAYKAAKRPSKAGSFLQHIVKRHPLSPQAKHAATLLASERFLSERAVQSMADGQLAALARAARLAPHRYMELGNEYRRARRYADAREAYGIFATRFDSQKAHLAAIDTYFEEGKPSEGLRATEVHLRRYPEAADAPKLVERLRKASLARGRLTEWAALCLRIASRLRGRAAETYLKNVANVLAKGALASSTHSSAMHDSSLVVVRDSPHRSHVFRLAEERIRSVREQVDLLGGSLDVTQHHNAASLDGFARFYDEAGSQLLAIVEPVAIGGVCRAVEKALRLPAHAAADSGQVKTGAPQAHKTP